MRKDWMDQLGLAEPETLEEAMDIIQVFQENRMGAEEGEDPVGLVCDTNFVSTTSQNYSVEPVFEKFYSYPRRWIKDKDGEIVYGSLTEETRSAVAYLRELYERGILDQNFALRAQNNLRDLVVEGKCGAFFDFGGHRIIRLWMWLRMIRKQTGSLITLLLNTRKKITFMLLFGTTNMWL